MSENDRESQRIFDEFEAGHALIKAVETGSFVYDDSLPVPELPEGPAADNVMVVRTFRMPHGLDEQVKAIAEQRGIDVSALLREWVAERVAADAADVPVSLADVMRAIAQVRPLPHAS